jgi:two-component system sensor histidine kinase/response regulator
MPEMNGYELCRSLKEEGVTSEIPVIFVTARSGTQDKIKGFDAGGVDYITKPFIPAEVLARVRTHLKLKALRDEKLRYHKELLRSQKMASITTLAGGIAHNINNLMGTVIGYADMLRDSLEHDERSRRYVSKILEASQGVADLTSDLLTYARAGRSADMSEVNIRELLYRMLELYKAPDGLHVDLQTPGDIPEVWANRDQILQALSNIFVNAQEVSPDNGTVVIAVSAGQLPSDQRSRDREYYVIISISDTGPGMDEDTAQRIFEPFFTTKQIVGAGLGLSASYGIIQKHDGVILIDTKPGEGTTFDVYIPIAQQSLAIAGSPTINSR